MLITKYKRAVAPKVLEIMKKNSASLVRIKPKSFVEVSVNRSEFQFVILKEVRQIYYKKYPKNNLKLL